MMEKLKWPWLKDFYRSRWSHPLLLLGWIMVGAGLRFYRLEAKPIWTDEFATIVFSLGNSFHPVPLDRAIALDTLLQPLQPHGVTVGLVIKQLLTESTHPPLYFVLAHLWLQMFPVENPFILLWASRAFSALLGVVSIPTMFGLGWLAFRSRLAGQFAAAMMAVSPLGVFLAQEARHYTLAILFVIASLSCFVVATQSLKKQARFPIWLGLIWVIVNSMGIATHYFFGLTIVAEGLVLLLIIGYLLLGNKSEPLPIINNAEFDILLKKVKFHNIKMLVVVAAGSAAGVLVWLPVWQHIKGNELTKWVYEGDPLGNFLFPLMRTGLWAISMLSLLPVDILSLPLGIAIASGVAMAIFLFWALPVLWQGYRWQLKQVDTRWGMVVLTCYVFAILALIFGLTYGIGTDLTLAARFHYIYFPSAIALIGASLAAWWPTDAGKKHLLPIAIVLVMGFIGGITAIGNLGYLQHERCDILARMIQKESNAPVLIATTHKHHGQTGRMMGLAWEFKRLDRGNQNNYPLFLLAHKHQGLCQDQSCNDPNHNPAITLPETVASLPRPLDVWLLNFHAPELLEDKNCLKTDPRSLPKVEGYRIRHYYCN